MVIDESLQIETGMSLATMIVQGSVKDFMAIAVRDWGVAVLERALGFEAQRRSKVEGLEKNETKLKMLQNHWVLFESAASKRQGGLQNSGEQKVQTLLDRFHENKDRVLG